MDRSAGSSRRRIRREIQRNAGGRQSVRNHVPARRRRPADAPPVGIGLVGGSCRRGLSKGYFHLRNPIAERGGEADCGEGIKPLRLGRF